MLFALGFRARTARPASISTSIPLRAGLEPDSRITAHIDPTNTAQALLMYESLTGRAQWPSRLTAAERLDDFFGDRLSRWHWVKRRPDPDSGVQYHRDGQFTAGEIKSELEAWFRQRGLKAVPAGRKYFRLEACVEKHRQPASGGE